MHPHLNIAIDAARKASQLILRSFDRLDELTVQAKGPKDFVSEVDQKAETIIIETLQDAFPSHGFLAEESGDNHSDAEIVWIIDPLDGTNNYLHGLPHFSISIAQQVNDRVELGMIYDPLRDELFTTERGKGAYLNNKRIRVAPNRQLKHALLATGFPFKNPEFIDAYFEKCKAILKQCKDIRRGGCASLDLAYVACGRFDGYWEYSLKPWDIAAGMLMVREAGGLVSDCSGGEEYLMSGDVLAASPEVFKRLLTGVKR